MNEIRYNTKGLDKLIRTFDDANRKVARVGILGKNGSRQGGESNASIGAQHEFGSITKKIPQRSFLRMPIYYKTKEIVEMVRAKFSSDLLSGVATNGFKVLGFASEMAIQEAFSSRGFGQWRPLSPITLANKKNDAILIETAQLRKSITSDVVKK